MGFWFALLALAALLTAAGLFYLLARLRRLSFLARLGEKNRALIQYPIRKMKHT